MRLRDIESALPPGFRFCPSDEELVCHYLHKKVNNHRISELLDVDLHIQEPWQLPEGAKLSDNEWYFFSFRDRKYATGLRSNRATKNGYWKATGKDRVIRDPSSLAMVGMRKTLVFYCGRAPNGVKTNWVMHEFRLETPDMPPKEDWVLCRVFLKSKGEAMDMGGDTSDFNEAIGTICSNSPYTPLPSIPLQVMCYADTATCYMQQHADPPQYGYSLPYLPRRQRLQMAAEATTEDATAMEGAEDAGNGDFSFLDSDCNASFQFLLGSVDDEGPRGEGSGSMDCAAVAFFSQL